MRAEERGQALLPNLRGSKRFCFYLRAKGSSVSSRFQDAALTYIQANSYSASAKKCRNETAKIRSTTVLLVRKDAHVALAGDGQVTLGETVMKASAKKVRRLYNDQILAGFAGATADAFSLLTRFESKLEQYHGNLERAAIELSKEWRTDKMLRHLEALLVVADNKSFVSVVGKWRRDRAG